MALHEWYLAAIIAISTIIVMLNYYVWQHRQSRGVMYYFVVNIFTLGLNASYFIITITESQTVAYDWIRLRFALLSILPMIALMFVTRFIRRPWWFSPPVEILAWGVPLLVVIALFTPALESYFFDYWSVLRLDGYSVEDRKFGPLYTVLIVHQLISALGVFYILFDYGLRVDSAWRRSVLIGVPPLAIMVVMSNLPITLGPPPGLRITPLMIGMAAISVGFLFFRYNTLSILPVTYDHILDSVQDGVLVIQQGVIVRANPAAVQLVGQRDMLNRPLAEVFPLSGDTLRHEHSTYTCEVTHRGLPLEVERLPLYHHQRVVGQTLILRDLTAQKQAAYEVLALAAERERSRLITQFLGRISNEFKTPMEILTDSIDGLHAEDKARRIETATQMEAKIDEMTRKIQELRKIIDQPLPLSPSAHDKVNAEQQAVTIAGDGNTST